MDSDAANYNSEAKKDDGSCVYTPNITIIAAADTTISVATEWTDPGATAANIDGAVVDVSANSDVDASQVGVYTVTYTATNNNGTTTAVRNVNVVINQDTWMGSWSVSDNCGGGTGLALNGSPEVIAGGNEEQILITDFFSGVQRRRSSGRTAAAVSTRRSCTKRKSGPAATATKRQQGSGASGSASAAGAQAQRS